MDNKIEKSAEEQLVDVIKTETAAIDAKVEAKADKSDLEGFVKSEEITDFVKSEEIAKLNEELSASKAALEELEAVVKAAPSIITGAKMENTPFIKWDNEGINAKAVIEVKSFDSQSNITGAPEASATVYHAMQQKNAFRSISTIMPITATSIKLPQVLGVQAAAENTIPASQTYNGDISSVDVVAQNWVSRNQFSDASVEDLPSLDAMVASFMGQAIARAEASI